MSFIFSIIAVTALVGVALAGVALDLRYFMAVVLPYAALATFVLGVAYRVLKWSSAPVPFRIPTTCGQAKGLDWVKTNKIDNPCSTGAVLARMFLEIFLFRSLFRNTRMEYREGGKVRYGSSKWLWLFGLLFHWSFLIVVLRHMRFFFEPVPGLIQAIEHADTFFEMGLPLPGPNGLEVSLPLLAQSGVILLAAATFLFLRRVVVPQVRYISLASDWFPLLLIILIAKTGIIMRYVLKVDVVAVKKLTMSLATFHPALPAEPISFMFYVHIVLVCTLLIYFPFSKLMHLGGVWLSPTRNLVNNSREVRHVNPWNPEVHFHTYSEYEDDFREQMIEAGIPVEKEA
ncbi:MAG: sulfate reduction electron transfer complex DsrMKJOP subunit DsrM [Desulfarculus sp.]|nr:sulfate reduction electron transfer complex DsrMKJOP subunit DsrM [Desulfarculus sp.]